jgi:hypothetical protein
LPFDLLLIQLAAVLLPGILWARIDLRFASKSKPIDAELGLLIVVYGLFSYSATFVVYAALGHPFQLIDLAASEGQAVLSAAVADEIIFATLIGVLLAIIWVYAVNYKLLTRILQGIGATKKYGDEDVWDFTFNSSDPAVEYVHVRDFENRIVYAGWVSTFSESGKQRELVLRDVQVFDFEGNQLFETPRLYLSRPPDNLHIEFPFKP